MSKSYIARYWSTTDRFLLGGVKQSASSRFSHREDAEQRLAAAVGIHGSRCEGEVVESDLYPELIRHCGKYPQAIGGRCFRCRKILTLEDARNENS